MKILSGIHLVISIAAFVAALVFAVNKQFDVAAFLMALSISFELSYARNSNGETR